jgi:hypothetical protein
MCPHLGIVPEQRVVPKGCPGMLHVEQPPSRRGGRKEQFPAEQPTVVALLRPASLLVLPLSHQGAEYAAEMVGEGSGLAELDQPVPRRLLDPAKQLVGNSVEGPREAIEQATVAVAAHQLEAIPENVAQRDEFLVLLTSDVNGRDQSHARIVEGVPLEELLQEIEGVPHELMSFVHRRVFDRRVFLGANQFAGQLGGAPGVTDSKNFPESSGYHHGRRSRGAERQNTRDFPKEPSLHRMALSSKARISVCFETSRESTALPMLVPINYSWSIRRGSTGQGHPGSLAVHHRLEDAGQIVSHLRVE